MTVDRQPREEHERDRRQRQPDGQHAPHPDPGHERLREGGEGDDREGQADVGQAGLERGVVEHFLHVQGEEEELREDRTAHQETAQVRGRERPQPEDAKRQERRLRSDLDREEGGDQRRGRGEEADRRRRAPAVLDGARHPIDQEHQAAGDRRGAGDVEVAVGEFGAALTEQPRSEPDDERADGDVDEEDPRPAEAAGQCPSEQDAGGSAAARDGAPDAECKVALAPFAEDGGQDREGRRGEQRRAEALQGAEGDQRAFRPGKAVQQRADGEERQPGDEQAPAPEQVGEAAAEEQHAAEEDRVGSDHPLQARLREVQVGADRRQRHVHDRDVEHDHELRCDDDREGGPAAPISSSGCCFCHNFRGHPLHPPIVDSFHDNKSQRLRATVIP